MMNFKIILLICCYFCRISSVVPKQLLTLGLVTPPDGKLGYPSVAAATTMAVEDAKSAGILRDFEIQVIWRNGNCDGKIALGVVVNLKYDMKVDAFIGLPCSIASINAGKLIAFWDLPHFSFSSADPELEDKVTYNTLIRLMSPFNRLADAMVEMFKHYLWDVAVMVEGKETGDGYCDFAVRAITFKFDIAGIDIGDRMRHLSNTDPSDATISSYLARIRKQGRIVILCGSQSMMRKVMLGAHRDNMTSGDYIFIYPSLLPSENYLRAWSREDDIDHIAKSAYFPFLSMALGFTTGADADEFMDLHPYRMAQPPWNDSEPLDEGIKGSTFSLFVYDTVFMYCMCAQKAHDLGSTPLNGTLMFDLAKNITFSGKSGFIKLDNNGDRIGDYTVWHLPVDGDEYKPLLDIVMNNPNMPIQNVNSRFWGPTSFKAPPSTPKCGFLGELCPSDNTTRDIIVISVAILVILLGLSLSVFIVMYRRKRFEQELEQMLWKVNWDDIEFHDKKAGQSMASSLATTKSMSSGSVMTELLNKNPHSSVQVGTYRGAMVAVKRLEKTGILLTRQDHLELKVMRDFNHENVNTFIGACVDPPNICVLVKYCSKGSLQDIIHNEDIKLDMNFRSSLMADIIQGMDYIHRSPLKSHGRLKSSNCVVDGRWVLRVTDCGLANFREQHPNDAPLWTAPELLRDDDPPKNGTQKGDVYSFAIILQELLYRAAPFEANGELSMLPKDIVGRVRNGETPPLRPILPAEAGLDKRLVELIQDSWEEDPSARPDFQGIKMRFNLINKGQRFNIMDNMLRMMEKYATNLEEVINERTRQLVEEKKKTDILLYRMLPAPVADALKTGKSIQPELYKQASVYFSDIVSFTNMCSESTPMEVIDFLNDLWTLFDDIIEKYNVYKVETIGDAYMVASGVPVANPTGHASEIADMGLDILSAVMTFKIRHKPENQLKVRIGIHCGPVVSGVVGQTMPRYCLFGDTVNTASRMESTGEALRIHLSDQAYQELKRSKQTYIMSRRGEIEIKGKGMQSTYWLEGKEGYTRPLPKYTD